MGKLTLTLFELIEIKDLFSGFQSIETQKELKEVLQSHSCSLVRGLVGSGITFRIGKGFLDSQRTVVVVCNDAEQAIYYQNDFQNVLPDHEILFLPSSGRGGQKRASSKRYDLLERSETLQRIQNKESHVVLITYPEAFIEKVLETKEVQNLSTTIVVDQEFGFNRLNEKLFEEGFQQVDFVMNPGEFATRGGIIDVFSYALPLPVRIEFFDDLVERISTFEVQSQRTIERLNSLDILPDVSKASITYNRKALMEIIHQECNYLFFDFNQLYQKTKKLKALSGLDPSTSPHEIDESMDIQFLQHEELMAQLDSKNIILLHESNKFSPQKVLHIQQTEQPDFKKKFELLKDHLIGYTNQGVKNNIFCSNQPQLNRIKDVLDAIGLENHYQVKPFPLYRGFSDIDAGILCYTEHQIFKRYHRYRAKWDNSTHTVINLKNLIQLKSGDFVTHIDHGIGKFIGLKTVEHNGKKQEVIRILYAENDVLDLSIHSLEKIARYNSKDGKPPIIYKLGSKKWENLKNKTRKRVKELAFDLVKLYAKRNQKIGNSCSPDSYLQAELEASFFYEDTPDQLSATKEVKQDMESERPMDRLICGDVGFGKTEVAIRAAFKAVDNGLQVAVLVPTTILAFQHYNTFQKRLEAFPVEIDFVSRFKTQREKNNILEKISDGSLDIIIGTHALVHPKIQFKKLGLLIVDEEQKFGVSVKEKLKNLKTNVDVLTLTATPIPRTLQFSLMSARDISLINTPPPNRYPVQTHIIQLDKALIQRAIRYEMRRKGRVYFVNDRIENIEQIKTYLQQLVPEARIIVGHGRKKGPELEQIMLGFIKGEYDVLVSTTIIENGLDVPQANTIFINQAHRYGLSDLYQMRGRVGRSNIKAFAYLITPKMSAVPLEAQKRIRSLEQFTELGQGIQVALKDLEIRGAGDILGSEQSGFISEMGFDTYHKILRETIEEMKNEVGLDLSQSDLSKAFAKNQALVQIITDIEAFIPQQYINVTSERILYYQKLNHYENIKQLGEIQEEVRDRFGPIPIEFKSLVQLVQVKRVAKELGIERLIAKNEKSRIFFNQNTIKSYSDEAFRALIQELHHIECPFKVADYNSNQEETFWIEIGWIEKFSQLFSVLKQLQKAVKYSSTSVSHQKRE
ncbi:MAG: transcription-repair coupling factor [Flavobacteriaceae bacterium]|nr:transcription-repair coupling factor [Flavobacteriaceae bacterium]MCY4267699.1 transcription-repair coupling factor [Flavobacteriaceae bacterium]